jgi:signal transduction histidine kinase
MTKHTAEGFSEHHAKINLPTGDNDNGIDENAISKIFNRFVQIEKSIGPGNHGTGLGLSVARSLVEMHGGRIWAESVEGKGSRFTFLLPINPNQAEAAAPVFNP